MTFYQFTQFIKINQGLTKKMDKILAVQIEIYMTVMIEIIRVILTCLPAIRAANMVSNVLAVLGGRGLLLILLSLMVF